MDRFQRLRYVTERYAQLQGLRLVPLGIPFLLSSAWRDGDLAWVPGVTEAGARIWFVGLFTAALAVSAVAKVYYRGRYGHVWLPVTINVPPAPALFAALLIAAVALQTAIQSPVSIPGTIVALALAHAGLHGGLVRAHYLAVALTVAALALSGAFGVPFHVRDVLWDRLAGLSLIVLGIGDDQLLRRTLRPVR